MLYTSKHSFLLSTFAVAAFATTASAQSFTEDFDLYPVGPLEGNAHSTGPIWHGWGGTNTNISLVSTNQSSSAPQSTEMVVGCDTVIDFDDTVGGNPMVAGKWTMTADLYIPGDFTGETFFIVLNEYDDPGTLLEWSIQVGFDGVTGQMVCDCGSAANFMAALIYDQWFECKWEIDLDGDWVDFYYDTGGVNLTTGYVWSGGVLGGSAYATTTIGAIDLYPDPTVTPVGNSVYIDNLNIVPVPDTGTAYCFGDISNPAGNVCPCSNFNDGSDADGAGCANAYFAAGAKLGASGVGSVTNDTVVLSGMRGQPNNSSMFFQANNNLDGNFVWLDNGVQCAGGGLIRLKVKMNGSGGDADSSPMVITTRSAQFNHVIQAGETLYYQWWYRETDDICQLDDDANTSNGYSITWVP
jgi:hypothetical protein